MKGDVCVKYLIERADELKKEIKDYDDVIRNMRCDLDSECELNDNKAYQAINKCKQIAERDLVRLEEQTVTINTNYEDFFNGINGVRIAKGGYPRFNDDDTQTRIDAIPKNY